MYIYLRLFTAHIINRHFCGKKSNKTKKKKHDDDSDTYEPRSGEELTFTTFPNPSDCAQNS